MIAQLYNRIINILTRWQSGWLAKEAFVIYVENVQRRKCFLFVFQVQKHWGQTTWLKHDNDTNWPRQRPISLRTAVSQREQQPRLLVHDLPSESLTCLFDLLWHVSVALERHEQTNREGRSCYCCESELQPFYTYTVTLDNLWITNPDNSQLSCSHLALLWLDHKSMEGGTRWPAG